MQNDLFLAPASRSGSAFEHLKRSVIEGIKIADLKQDVCPNKDGSVRIWGLTTGLRSEWKCAESGDWLLFYTGEAQYQYAAQILGKAHDPRLGEQIRSEFLHVTDKEIREGKKWEFLLYLYAPINIDLSADLISDWLGYERAYQSRFQRVSGERLTVIEDKFGSLDALIEEFRE
jgi:hypothetical protein